MSGANTPSESGSSTRSLAWDYSHLELQPVTVHELVYKRGFVKVNHRRAPITSNDIVEESLGKPVFKRPRNKPICDAEVGDEKRTCLSFAYPSLRSPVAALLQNVGPSDEMWRHFDVYRTSVDMALLKHNLQCPEYDRLTFTMMDHELKHTGATPAAKVVAELRNNIKQLALHSISSFIEALKLAKGSRLEDTLRLMALLFDITETLPTELRNGLKKLPPEMWLEAVPQLIARLEAKNSQDTREARNAGIVKQVILDVSKVYPQALVYPITVAAKSSGSENGLELFTLFSDMSPKHNKLAEEAKLVTEELVRCAILWHEQWNEALDEASRLYFQENDIPGFLATLDPMHQRLKTAPMTIKEHSFVQTYFADLTDALKFCNAYRIGQDRKELAQAWEIYINVFKRIQGQLRQLTSLDLTYVSPKLKNAKDLSISVPGTYDPAQTDEDIVRISYVDTLLTVISSKQKPRKMQMRGSNGRDYMFLLKGHEDPRQDERVMQLFGLVNAMLAKNEETGRTNLAIQRYSIIALSQNSGLIGWVPNCDTLHTLVKEYREKKKISLSAEHKEMQANAQDLETLPLDQKVQLFNLALAKTSGDDLQKILWLKSPSSEVWFDRRTNYTRSMAVMSMVGYILGLGDRHPSNLMLDRLTGKIVHIDFGDCFEVAMSREKYPEKIPFRLTRMLIKAMEVCGINGNYRHTSERVLGLLRANKDSLLAVLEAFVNDPNISWRLLEVNRQRRNPAEKQDISKMVKDEGLSQESARKIVERIKSKLIGHDFEPEREYNVVEQFNKLVEEATNAENLCQCYVGWCPFW
ncbi:unnamed protein product, partial [Mesorhabditis spiculigera]